MRVRVWLPPLAELRPDSNMTFEVLDKNRRIQHRGEATLGSLPKNMPCELVLHSTDAVLMDIRPPRLRGAKLASALPALVEERLASSVENVHVVATPRDPDGTAVAIVVDRGLLQRALDQFRRVGRSVVAVVPYMLALAYAPDRWRVRIREGAGGLRSGPAAGIAFEVTYGVPVELQLYLKQAVAPPSVLEIDGDCDPKEWSEALQIAARQVPPDGEAPPMLVNLLQYRFAPSVANWKQWRVTGILAVLLCLVMLLGMNLHAWILQSQARQLRAGIEAVVSETIPGVPAVLDPVAQMRRRLDELRTGAGVDAGGFLSLALDVSQIADFGSVRSFSYRDGKLTVAFEPASVDEESKRQQMVARASDVGLTLQFSEGAEGYGVATVTAQGRP